MHLKSWYLQMGNSLTPKHYRFINSTPGKWTVMCFWFLQWTVPFLKAFNFWLTLCFCRWWAAWTPTPAGTVRQCESRGPDRRSSRTWPLWCESSWSSSTNQPATSQPGSSSTGTECQRDSSDRYNTMFLSLTETKQAFCKYVKPVYNCEYLQCWAWSVTVSFCVGAVLWAAGYQGGLHQSREGLPARDYLHRRTETASHTSVLCRSQRAGERHKGALL